MIRFRSRSDIWIVLFFLNTHTSILPSEVSQGARTLIFSLSKEKQTISGKHAHCAHVMVPFFFRALRARWKKRIITWAQENRLNKEARGAHASKQRLTAKCFCTLNCFNQGLDTLIVIHLTRCSRTLLTPLVAARGAREGLWSE